jgi:hypothetical protein
VAKIASTKRAPAGLDLDFGNVREMDLPSKGGIKSNVPANVPKLYGKDDLVPVTAINRYGGETAMLRVISVVPGPGF